MKKSNFLKSKVYFVGAGPGDPDLITIKAMRILSQADIILTDRLASDHIIELYASKNAVICDVGKNGGNSNSFSQQQINDLLLQSAGIYKKIVRLKGGDVSVFSNIHSELETLLLHCISYEIVPGISAASGAAAYTGIPLTARGFATGVQYLTHYKDDIISAHDWSRLAAFKDTLIFYMSSNNLQQIVTRLLHAGADPDIPFVVIEQATTKYQAVYEFSLKSFAEQTASHFISPSLVIMGRVVGLYARFQWWQGAGTRDEYFRSVSATKDGYLKTELLSLSHSA